MPLSQDMLKQIYDTAAALTSRHTGKESGSVNRPGLKSSTVQLLTLLRSAMYPQIFAVSHFDENLLHLSVSSYLEQAAILLCSIIADVRDAADPRTPEEITAEYISGITEVAAVLETDIRAAYEGDPAARSEEEIMLAYPAFEAISIFRLAHALYVRRVPLLPRMMTEYAHQITGIDIHPGAQIGKYFFIDHGTGVVIGETCVIGEHVKLYQGVTLGAKSFELDENGNPVKGIKRHPDIGNHVIIYAGATILGGDTVIGDGCTIGGNVWLTHSVAPGTIVYYNNAAK